MKRWTKVVCLKNVFTRTTASEMPKKFPLLKCKHPKIFNCQCMNPGLLLSPKRGSKYKHRNIKGILLKIFLKNYLASVSNITVQKSWDFVDFKWISYDPRLFRGPIMVERFNIDFFSKLFYNTLLKKYIAEFSDITKISIVIPSYPDNIVTELLSLFITFEFCSFFNYVIFDTLSPIKIRLFSWCVL